MLVAADISELYHPLRTGVFRCRAGMLEGLLALAGPELIVRLFSTDRFGDRRPRLRGEVGEEIRARSLVRRLDPRRRRASAPADHGSAELRPARSPGRAARVLRAGLTPVRLGIHGADRRRVARRLRRELPSMAGRDAVIWSGALYGHLPGVSNWLIVHDATPALIPESHQAATVRDFAQLLRYARGHDYRIITISDHARAEITDKLQWPADRIWTVPLGVDQRFGHESDGTAAQVRALRERLGTSDGRMVLAVGTLEPRKNLGAALDAFELLSARHPPGDVTLVLAGEITHGWKNEALLARIAGYPGPGRIVTTGFVPDTDLPNLYRAADVFVYPSLYEGFGLPALEAMAAGVPVVATNRTAVPEVVGDAALLIDPADPGAIADAIWSVLSDSAQQDRLRRAGRRRADSYTWARTAERLRQVLTGDTAA